MQSKRDLPPLPPDAPFEICPTIGAGLGAFATKNIGKMCCILREKPLFAIWKPEDEITPEDVEAEFAQLQSRGKELFLSLTNSGNQSLASRWDTFMRNRLSMGDSINGTTSTSGQGMYLLCPRFNHSCVPNAIVLPPSNGSKCGLEIYTIQPVAKGKELNFSYNANSNFLTAKQRQTVRTWDFTCKCPACNPNNAFHYVSDMRRTLLRGLYYLIHGQDAVGCEGTEAPVFSRAMDTRKESSWKQEINRISWRVISGHLALAEGLKDTAADDFTGASLEALMLHRRGHKIREECWSDILLWAAIGLDAVKCCRPVGHAGVEKAEAVWDAALKLQNGSYR